MNTEEWFIDADKLPQPLPKEEVNKLLKLVNEGSKEAVDTLARHNIRLILKIVSNQYMNVDYDKKELVAVGSIGLTRAIKTFDISNGAEFTTYAGKCINNEILAFLRKLERHQNVDSLDRTIYTDNDGNETKLEDTISDDTINFVEDYETKDVYRVVRTVVENLKGREKEMIMLYFGFYNNKTYNFQEIGDMFNMSKQNVARIISFVVKKISRILENMGVIELHKMYKKKNYKLDKVQTIYEYFENFNYTRRQVNKMLKKLNDEDKILLRLRYGQDLDNPVLGPITYNEVHKFYMELLPKMKNILLDISGKKVLFKKYKN